MKNIIKFAMGLVFTVLFVSLYPVFADRTSEEAQVDELVNQQKYAEALKLVRESITRSKAGKKDREWAKLIVKEAMLEIGLHGYETGVKDLRSKEWPKEPVAHALVSLAYARTLQLYHQSYSWEIRKREKVSGRENFDLKTMTSDEIYAEAYSGFAKAWAVRDELGKRPRNELPEIITPNNYPQEVRGTFRDTLTYLISTFFQDTSGWTAEQSNTTYAYDVSDLEKQGKVELTDLSVHPLKKIAYVLKDLEQWNAGTGKKEAALEARLEFYRNLWAQLSSVTAKKKIKDSLEKEISRQKSNPWVSMAYAQLAEFNQNEQDLVTAMSWAKKGAAIFPKSPGAAKCRDIISVIEQPSLNAEGMNIDGSPKRTLSVNYKNLRKVYFRSHKVDFRDFIGKTKDYSLRPAWHELEKILKTAPVSKWEADLKETSDYKQHRAYITPPAHKNGFYVILISNTPDFNTGVVTGVELFISDFTFQVSRDYQKQMFKVEVLSGEKGEPVKNAAVSLYSADYRNGHKLQEEEKTDDQGVATFVTRSILNTNNNFFFVVEKDGQIVGSKNPDAMYASSDTTSDPFNAFIYTDRSIYRPEQKILWKIVAYRGKQKEKTFRVDTNESLTVELRDANYQPVQKVTVKTNKFGSASGEFLIPKGKLLGNWSISSSHDGAATIKVEEYKRPTFTVEFDEKVAELRLNKEAVLKGKAKYYFGMPLTKGKVAWTVNRQAILPWWCFWGRWDWSGITRGEMVATGIAALKEDGTFEFKFKPTADEDVSNVKDIKYSYQVKADITDEGGETRSAELSNTIGFIAVSATLSTSEKFFVADSQGEMSILRTDLSGRALKGKGKWTIVRMKTPAKTLAPADIPMPAELKKMNGDRLVLPDDTVQPRWSPDFSYELYLRQWEDGETVSSGESEHGDNGKYALKIPALKEGAYRVRYETKDSFGATFEEQKEFLVIGKKTTFPIAGLLLIQKGSVEPGEKAKIFVTSGFSKQRLVFERFRSGKLLERKVLVSGKDDTLIEIPVTEEDRGGMSFTLALINDYQDIKYTEHLMVPWSNKIVDVEFSTMRDKMKPGGKETWAITIKGKNGRKIEPETFELLAYMYDKSLDAFGPHSPPTPLSVFPSSTGSSYTDSELGPGTLLYTNLSYFPISHEFNGFRADQVTYYPNYGIGGPGSRGVPGGGMRMKGAAAFDGIGNMADSAMEAAAPMMLNEAAPAPSKVASRAMEKESKKEVQSAAKPEAADAPVEMRTNFSETAFWKPHLVPGKDGKVSFEFTVPDSVTAWSVWAHAISKDLQNGRVMKDAQTIKELMIRPYLPRFFREGDEAEIKLVINNSGDKELKGTTSFEILDEEGKKSLAKEFSLSDSRLDFTVKAGGSVNVSVKVKVPAGPGNITVKAIARSGNISDGETRSIPILPGRMHLAQSKFATLINKDKASLTFPDLEKNNDPTLINDLFVVTLDAQLFYSVLSSLPYLVNYPYQCTEQMMNSFVSSGIISSVFEEFPEVGKMAKEFSKRKTRLESWDDKDPNRKIALEEAPWLQIAQGGEKSEDSELISVLHPDIARNTREKYLKLLRNSQTASGGFPWFSGGPPSPWITMYLLYGFSKAIEFKVGVPKDMIKKAWGYLHEHYVREVVSTLIHHDVGWETVTFLNYILSSYPNDSWTGGVFTAAERKVMLDFSFKHWKEHNPYMKSYLSLTLLRSKRNSDAKLVWDSVMDSAKTSKEEGTHWAQEDRSWLWYNDTIETHALALRTGSEIGTKKDSLDGLVHWLFLNKKLNHWKSTRATAEVIYSLTHYLKKNKQLGIHETINVMMNGETKKFDFDPAKYTGKKNQIVYPAEKVSSKLVPVTVEKSTPGLAFASATWHYSTEKLPKEAVGDFFKVNRKYFKRIAEKSGMKLIPVKEGDEIEVGDEVEVQISLSSKHAAEYVHLRDPRAAGFEPVDPVSQHKWDLGIYWYEEIRDNGTNFFFERLPHGQYTFKYRIRASMAGKFRAGPATIQPLYAPEFVGFSEGHELKIRQQK